MLIVHKSVNSISPVYISELLKVYTPSRNLRSSNMSLLKEPTSKRTWGDRSFSVVAPRLWNHLPTKLKSCHSITRFKSLLKTHLMSQFFKDDVYFCTCISVHNFVFCYCLYSCFFCFRALSTQQGGLCARYKSLILLLLHARNLSVSVDLPIRPVAQNQSCWL